MSIIVLETKEVTVGGKLYIIKAFPAMIGLRIQSKLLIDTNKDGIPSAELIRETIIKGATLGSATITDEMFDKIFSKKYTQVMELFDIIFTFNFGVEDEGIEGEGKNDESDTSVK